MECNIELIEFLRDHPRHRRALRRVQKLFGDIRFAVGESSIDLFFERSPVDALPQIDPIDGIQIHSRYALAPMSLDHPEVTSDIAHKTITRDRCVGAEGPYCRLMADSLHDEVNCDKPGLTVIVKHFRSKPDGEHFGVAIKRKSKIHRMIDYCPWCGVLIRKMLPGAGCW